MSRFLGGAISTSVEDVSSIENVARVDAVLEFSSEEKRISPLRPQALTSEEAERIERAGEMIPA